eukprot:jgi/Tetstr1/427839/TSEL_001810.t1
MGSNQEFVPLESNAWGGSRTQHRLRGWLDIILSWFKGPGDVNDGGEDAEDIPPTPYSTRAQGSWRSVNLKSPSRVCLCNPEEAVRRIEAYEKRAAISSLLKSLAAYVLMFLLLGGLAFVSYSIEVLLSLVSPGAMKVAFSSWAVAVALDLFVLEYVPLMVGKIYDKVAKRLLLSSLLPGRNYCHQWYDNYSDVTTFEMLQHTGSLDSLKNGIDAVKLGRS